MWILVGILGQKKVKTEGIWGFPDGSVGKESTCNAGNPGDAGLIPGMGRSLEEKMATTLVFLPEKSHGQRSLAELSMHTYTRELE